MKLNNPYQTVIEAASQWQKSISDIIQAGGHGQFPLFTFADKWPVEKNGNKTYVDGLVQLDEKDVLRAMVSDFVCVSRVKQKEQWFTIESSKEVRFGVLFVEKRVYEQDSQRSETSTAKSRSNRPLIDDDPLMSVNDAAGYLKLARNTLDKYRSNGTGPEFVQAGSRSIRYRKSALDRWVVKH